MTRRLVLLSSMFALAGLAHAGGPTATATYSVTLEATWSASTHPDAYPPGAHFSGPVGGTHDGTLDLWEPGELASGGIEAMAEDGNPNPLAFAVNQAVNAGSAGQVINGGFTAISSPGSWNGSFTADLDHTLVTITTMVAPTPDWFVGLDGLDLMQGGDWVDSISVDLFPYDAGTEDGEGFSQSNPPTNPAEPIAAITTGDLANGTPVATFVITRTDTPATFQNLGSGLAGTNGTPLLQPSGTLVGGTPFTLALTNAVADSTTTLFVGISAINANFKGGTLVPAPDFILPGLPTDAAGGLTLNSTFPAGLPPGVPLFFQYWHVDPAGPKGLAASNGICGTTP